jgi:hypothetical protein
MWLHDRSRCLRKSWSKLRDEVYTTTKFRDLTDLPLDNSKAEDIDALFRHVAVPDLYRILSRLRSWHGGTWNTAGRPSFLSIFYGPAAGPSGFKTKWLADGTYKDVEEFLKSGGMKQLLGSLVSVDTDCCLWPRMFPPSIFLGLSQRRLQAGNSRIFALQGQAWFLSSNFPPSDSGSSVVAERQIFLRSNRRKAEANQEWSELDSRAMVEVSHNSS